MNRKTVGLVVVASLVLVSARLFADKRLDDAVAKSDEQFQKGKVEEALKTLKKVVDQDPTAEPLLAYGRLQERAGNIDDAEKSLKKAADLSGSAGPAVRGSAFAALSAMDLRHGTSKDAVAHAQEAVKAQENATTLAALARAQLRTNPAAALQTADKAVAADARSAAAAEARGEALLGLRRADEAAVALRKALELDPKQNLARIRLAEALLAQGKAAEAVITARQATDADSKSGEAFAVLGTVVLASDPKKWDEAIEAAQQGATVLDPQNPAVQVAVGKILEVKGNLDQAAAAYRKAVTQDADYLPANQALVQILLAQGAPIDGPQGPLALAQTLARNYPDSPEVQLQLGRLLLRKKNYAEASLALGRAVELAPNVAEAHAFLGTADQYLGKSKEAADEYKRAVEVDPSRLDYRTTYGLLLGVVKQYQAGIDQLKKVVAAPGYKSPDAWVNLGWVYRNAEPKRIDESLVAYKKALDIDPKNSQAALGMGWDYSYSRLWDESIGAFNKAAQLDPELSGEAYDGIAWCYFFKKDLPQARAYLDKAAAGKIADAHLKSAIDRLEDYIKRGEQARIERELRENEGPKEPVREVGCDVGGPVNILQKPTATPEAKRRAAGELARCGAPAVPYLSSCLDHEPEVIVRQSCAASLCVIGPAAASAVPSMKRALSYQAPVLPNPTKKQMEEEMQESDLKRAIRDCLKRIEGH